MTDMLVFDGEILIAKHQTEKLVCLTVITDAGDIAEVMLDWEDVDQLIERLQEHN